MFRSFFTWIAAPSWNLFQSLYPPPSNASGCCLIFPIRCCGWSTMRSLHLGLRTLPSSFCHKRVHCARASALACHGFVSWLASQETVLWNEWSKNELSDAFYEQEQGFLGYIRAPARMNRTRNKKISMYYRRLQWDFAWCISNFLLTVSSYFYAII